MSFAVFFLGFCLVFAAFVLVSVRIYQVKPDFIKKILRYSLIAAFAMAFSIIALSIGFRIQDRHSSSYRSNYKSVQGIWGGSISQPIPRLRFEGKTIFKEIKNKNTGEITRVPETVLEDMAFDRQKIAVKINSNTRKKGLLKYPGFDMEFSGKFVLKNLNQTSEKLSFSFQLPRNAGNITNLQVKFQGKKYILDSDFSNGVQWRGRLAPGESRTMDISYRARGMERFVYSLGSSTREIRNLHVNVETNFKEIQIPEGAMVPSNVSGDDNLTQYTWTSGNLITGQNIALKFSIPGNYGNTISRMFFYSPMAIFLFLGTILIFIQSNAMRFHPMNYLFLLTGFFIFYLLGSYLISYMPIIPAIVMSLGLSTAIMMYYLFLIKKGSDLMKVVLFSAIVFQWIFSSAFFFREHTGFLITLASIVAFIFMIRATANVDWDNKW